MTQPETIGHLLRRLFIIRPDGSVDHDMVVALSQAAAEHDKNDFRNKNSDDYETTT